MSFKPIAILKLYSYWSSLSGSLRNSFDLDWARLYFQSHSARPKSKGNKKRNPVCHHTMDPKERWIGTQANRRIFNLQKLYPPEVSSTIKTMARKREDWRGVVNSWNTFLNSPRRHTLAFAWSQFSLPGLVSIVKRCIPRPGNELAQPLQAVNLKKGVQ